MAFTINLQPPEHTIRGKRLNSEEGGDTRGKNVVNPYMTHYGFLYRNSSQHIDSKVTILDNI